MLAVRNDEEIHMFLGEEMHGGGGVTIPSGGVLPNIHAILLPRVTLRDYVRPSRADDQLRE